MDQKSVEVSDYQVGFIEFLLRAKVINFGKFTLKSGRTAPYFFNFGQVNEAVHIKQVGEFYAAHILAHFGSPFPNVVFGPAYKGISLAVATVIALENLCPNPPSFCFNRKEAKDRGEGGIFVGKKLGVGDHVVIVEDVVTAGTTFREVVPMIRGLEGVNLLGGIIAVDRCEKGTGTLTAVDQIETELATKISPILTIHQILSYLSSGRSPLRTLSSDEQSQAKHYLETYGV